MLYPTASHPFPDPTDASTYSLTPTLGSTSANVTDGQLRFTDTIRRSFTYAAVDIPNSSRVTIEADVGTLPENNDIPLASAFTSPGVFVGNLGFDFVPNATIGGGSLFLRNTTFPQTFTQGYFYRFNTEITAGFGSTFQFAVDVQKTGETTADVDMKISTGAETFATSVSFIDVKNLNTAGLFMVNDGFPTFDNVFPSRLILSHLRSPNRHRSPYSASVRLSRSRLDSADEIRWGRRRFPEAYTNVSKSVGWSWHVHAHWTG